MQSGNFSNSKKFIGQFFSEKCKLAIFRNPKNFLFWAQFFEIVKMSASGNFSKSEIFSHPSFFQQYWQFCKIWKIASLGNLSKSETCRHKKIVPNLTNFPINHFFNSMHLPHDEIRNCFFLVLRCVVSFAGICHNIPTDVFNFTQVWGGRITEIQKQLDVTICFPCLEEIFAMLNQTDRMCSFHSKMWYSFPVILYFWILYQLRPGCINLSELWLSAIMRPACSWCTKFSWFQTIPVTLVHHTVLGQLCYVLLFVTTCTESSCQRRWQVIWAII